MLGRAFSLLRPALSVIRVVSRPISEGRVFREFPVKSRLDRWERLPTAGGKSVRAFRATLSRSRAYKRCSCGGNSAIALLHKSSSVRFLQCVMLGGKKGSCWLAKSTVLTSAAVGRGPSTARARGPRRLPKGLRGSGLEGPRGRRSTWFTTIGPSFFRRAIVTMIVVERTSSTTGWMFGASDIA